MKLLLSIVFSTIFLLMFEKQIKKYSTFFYIATMAIGLFTAFAPQTIYPSWMGRWISSYITRGTVATALFVIVMYAVLMPKKSRLLRTFMGLRGEIAIMVSLLILSHNICYGQRYFRLLFTDIGQLQVNEKVAAVLSVCMILLLIPLTVTSFKCIRKKMNARKWKKLQRWSYLFYGMLYAMDTVSGATFSSKGICAAVKDALQLAQKQ